MLYTLHAMSHSRAWTREDLRALRSLAAKNTTLAKMAERLRRSRVDCDLALWAMLGSEPDEALLMLNARLPGGLVRAAPARRPSRRRKTAARA